MFRTLLVLTIAIFARTGNFLCLNWKTDRNGKQWCQDDKRGGSWAQAEATCRTYFGHLAVIETLEDQTFFTQEVIDKYGPGQYGPWWIGLAVPCPGANLTWSDGSVFTNDSYSNWQESASPSEGHGHCTLIDKDSQHFRWQFSSCVTRHYFVCQREGNFTESPTNVSEEKDCDLGWCRYKNACYTIGNDDVAIETTWEKAEAECQSKANNSHLISIENEAENAFILQLVKVRDLSDYKCANCYNDTTSFWLGFSKLHRLNGKFMWLDGTKASFQNWAPGEPNNGDDGHEQSCVQMYISNTTALSRANLGKWNDARCDVLGTFGCKRYDEAFVPTPTTLPLPAQTWCRTGWYSFNGRCFKLFGHSNESRLPFYHNGSLEACQALGTSTQPNLAKIDDVYENLFLVSLMRESVFDDVWIGMFRPPYRAGSNYWVDETTTSYDRNINVSLSEALKLYCAKFLTTADQVGNWGLEYSTRCETLNLGYVCAENPTFEKPTANTLLPYECDASSTNKTCFSSIGIGSTWHEAEQYCRENNGGHLVSIQDIFDFASIVTTAHSSKLQEFWIGLYANSTTAMENASFAFSDGSILTKFSVWAKGEPNTTSETEPLCVKMVLDKGMKSNEAYGSKWIVEKCDKRLPFLCHGFPGSKKAKGLTPSIIAAIVIVTIAILLLIGTVTIYGCRRRRHKCTKSVSFLRLRANDSFETDQSNFAAVE